MDMAPRIVRWSVGGLMVVGLLLLMPYSLVGAKAHEWLGAGMMMLLFIHLLLNRRWFKSVG